MSEYVTNSSDIFLCIVLVLLLVLGLLKKDRIYLGGEIRITS